MRREVVFHIGQQPGRFITGRLDYPAIERRQGRRHALMPRCLIAGLSGLFHNNEVAIWVHGDEAQAAGKGLVLGHREVFVGHVLGQACGLALAGVSRSFCWGPHKSQAAGRMIEVAFTSAEIQGSH